MYGFLLFFDIIFKFFDILENYVYSNKEGILIITEHLLCYLASWKSNLS